MSAQLLEILSWIGAGLAGVVATLAVKRLFFADEFPSVSVHRRTRPGLPHHRRKGTLT